MGLGVVSIFSNTILIAVPFHQQFHRIEGCISMHMEYLDSNAILDTDTN